MNKVSFMEFVVNMPKTFTTQVKVFDGNDWVIKQYDFRLTIDVGKVKHQITQAYKNKSRKCVDGAVIVERY